MAKSQPYQRNVTATVRMAICASSPTTSSTSGFAVRGNTSTSKCEPSRTAIIEPIRMIQTKQNRAISSVQIKRGMIPVYRLRICIATGTTSAAISTVSRNLSRR